jgi:Dolichyl-phosphate-mannose-protein mannosyltransferase
MPHGDTVAARSGAAVVPDRPAPRPDRLARVLAWVDRVSASLERRGLYLFAALSVLYWVLTVVLARRKLMWNDELYTYYMAMLPSTRDVWEALLSGGEQTPPFFYFMTRLAFESFGVNHVSIRMPQMLGYWVMIAALLVFVRRRTSWFPALCAAAFPLVTRAYSYAFEARPYSLVLGFAGLALVSWQAVTLGTRRVLWLVCLAASLAAAVATHYYAVLVIIPLALGEATRTIVRRRLDLPVWAALAAPILPLVLHLPLIRVGQAYSSAFWAPPQWVNVPDFYVHLLEPAVVAVAAIVVLTAAHASMARTHPTPDPAADAPIFPAAEVIAACGFVVLPFVYVVAAKVATGAFTYRYALPTVLGLALLAGFGTAALFRSQPAMRLTVATCLVGWFALSQARELIYPTWLSLPVHPNDIRQAAEWLKEAPGGELPFVVADPHTFAVLSHYGPPEVKARMVYLADPGIALQQLGHNSVERGMLGLLKPWFRLNVQEFEPFFARHSQFLVYGDFYELAFLNWMGPELQRRGVHLELLNRKGDYLFLLASRSTPDR